MNETSSVQQLSQEKTIDLLLQRSGRNTRTVPIRRAFVQNPLNSGAGPLAKLVHHKQVRALDLLLLVHAVASAGDFSVTEWSTTWARTLGKYDDSSGPAAVSRAWKTLGNLQLISRTRENRKTKITKLKEDGLGLPYAPPRGEKYFQVPFEYWTGGFNRTLTLSAKAMLLIALSQRKYQFALPQERMPEWYGISADVAGKGLQELRRKNVLIVTGE
ncbi:hypothetical protein [Actinacidiphila oryziradicis]|uniref:Uncharacterized protein n=1 Tax=Actinacidiphila oryziradicis TaxID=2571141 RepID=A0A4U0RFV2_9ACTN|nr:hypothetical protein [Actinacidiphila oryziradicis]TJZ94359.1 hypothetical protein FCI23_53915 [Actinacidiphila oryziradicis]